MKAFVKTSEKTRDLLASDFDGRVLWDIFADEVRAVIGEFEILADGRRPGPHTDRALYVDSRYCLLSRETIRAALQTSRRADAPLQAVFESEFHPVKTMESVSRVHGPVEVRGNRWEAEIARDEADATAVWWVCVTALGAEGAVGFGCRDFSVPPNPAEPLDIGRGTTIARPDWGAAEIALDLRVSVGADGSARFVAEWAEVSGAHRCEIALYRAGVGEGEWYKGFTAPGVAHFDICHGRLVRPTDGAYLRNRQALPRLGQRCEAIIIGTAEEAARLERGEWPRGALAFALPRNEALCVADTIDVLRCEVALERRAGKTFAGAQAI